MKFIHASQTRLPRLRPHHTSWSETSSEWYSSPSLPALHRHSQEPSSPSEPSSLSEQPSSGAPPCVQLDTMVCSPTSSPSEQPSSPTRWGKSLSCMNLHESFVQSRLARQVVFAAWQSWQRVPFRVVDSQSEHLTSS